jgi:hypothetical protein
MKGFQLKMLLVIVVALIVRAEKHKVIDLFQLSI